MMMVSVVGLWINFERVVSLLVGLAVTPISLFLLVISLLSNLCPSTTYKDWFVERQPKKYRINHEADMGEA